MHPLRRVAAAVLGLVLRHWPARPVSPEESARADFSTHPGGKGLRFTDHLRERFLRKWLRLRNR